MVHEVEENAACVEVGELEGAGVGLDQAVHQADHQKGAKDFLVDLLEENLQVHPPGYLMEMKERKLIIKIPHNIQVSKALTLVFCLTSELGLHNKTHDLQSHILVISFLKCSTFFNFVLFLLPLFIFIAFYFTGITNKCVFPH